MNITQQRVIESIARGYYVTEEGEVFGPKGKLSVKLYGAQRYPTYSTNWGGRVYGVPVHMLAAYCFYGIKAFNPDLVIRHLDGNTLNLSKRNIVLGTHSENNLDKPASVRRAAAVKARAAQGRAAKNRKLTDEQVALVKSMYKKYEGRKPPNGIVTNLAKELGVTRQTLHKIKTGEYYAC